MQVEWCRIILLRNWPMWSLDWWLTSWFLGQIIAINRLSVNAMDKLRLLRQSQLIRAGEVVSKLELRRYNWMKNWLYHSVQSDKVSESSVSVSSTGITETISCRGAIHLETWVVLCMLSCGKVSTGFTPTFHDDVIQWKYFPRYWPFVRRIHRSTGGFPSQRPVTRSFDAFLDLRLNKRFSKHSRRRWFRRHCAHHDVSARRQSFLHWY